MADDTEIYAIFEGGGAKGLAHVAALAEAQRKGLVFKGVAGTSAGAIVAALVAVGYTAKQLYDPASRQGLMAGSLTDFFDKQTWADFKEFSASFEKKFKAGTSPWSWLWLYLRWRKHLGKLSRNFGLMQTAPIEAVIDQWLLKGNVDTAAGQPRVLFKDLKSDLRIIASDIDTRSAVVFSRDETPNVAVAQAVAASIAIPLFFRPVKLDIGPATRTLVDGGIVANFPAWVFNAQLRRVTVPTRVVGFRLFASARAGRAAFVQYMDDLYNTALDANIELHARGLDDLVMIPIKVGISTFDFELTERAKYDLYQHAARQVKEGLLANFFPRHPDVLRRLLRETLTLFCRWSGIDAGALRANIAVPTVRATLRIVCGLNMENDADDQLEFELAASASGESWTSKTVVVFDIGQFLVAQSPVPGLNKYQRALVRPSLSTIMSVPIFEPGGGDTSHAFKDNPLIGILNFDSDSVTVTQFERSKSAAEWAAVLLGSYLKSPMPADGAGI